MDENKMEWREYARYAEMSVEELGARLRGAGVSRDGSGRTGREHDGLGGAHEAWAHRGLS